jgi:hypothetical protein
MLWSRVRRIPEADQRATPFARVLDLAVSHTRYAKDYDSQANIADLPRIPLSDFLRHPERYIVASARNDRRYPLYYPLGTPPRTAVVGRAVRENWRVRGFRSLSSPDLLRFKPDAIAAPLDALRAHVADAMPLRNSLLPFSSILSGPLSLEDADLFWAGYQVPVFEQFLGFAGELLAFECEVHHGLHICAESAHFSVGSDDAVEVSFLANPRLPVLRLDTGLAGRLVNETGPCGESSPRLINLRRRETAKREEKKFSAVSAVG